MQWLFDETGRRYLDVRGVCSQLPAPSCASLHADPPSLNVACARPPLQAFAGIVTVSVGHCHPEVVAAVNQQSQLLQHTTTIYLNHQIAEYAKELADRMPGNLKVSCLHVTHMCALPCCVRTCVLHNDAANAGGVLCELRQRGE